MAPERRPDRSDTRPPGAFLFPKLLARSRHLPASFGSMRSRTPGGGVVLDRFPKKVLVDGAENFLGEIHRPDLRPAQVVDINRCHIRLTQYQVPVAMLFSPLASLPSTDRPWSNPRIRDARAALSLL